MIEKFKKSYIQGNCIELMAGIADDTVDLILTDPPYSIDYHNNRRQVKGKTLTEKGIKNDSKDNLDVIEYAAEDCYRILKPGRHMYWFGRADMIHEHIPLLKDAGFTIKNVLIWLKNNHGTGDLNYSYASRYECIVYAMKWNDAGDNLPLQYVEGRKRTDDILEFAKVPSAELLHDHQKPLPLLELLIKKSSLENDLVFDPFAGSGSTIIAALKANRRAIGCELDETIHSEFLKYWEERADYVRPNKKVDLKFDD